MSGRPPKLKPHEIAWAKIEWQKGTATKDICWGLGITIGTLERYAGRYGFGERAA